MTQYSVNLKTVINEVISNYNLANSRKKNNIKQASFLFPNKMFVVSASRNMTIVCERFGGDVVNVV